MRLKLASVLLLASLTLVFIAQNVAVVEIRFLVWGLSMSLSLLVFLLFALGAAAGWLLHSYALHKKQSTKTA